MSQTFKINLADILANELNKFAIRISSTYGVDLCQLRKVAFLKHESYPMVPMVPIIRVSNTKEKRKLFEEAGEFIVRELPSMKSTLIQLKSVCARQGLKTGGTKQELLTRLCNPTLPENKSKSKKSIYKGTSIDKILEKLKGPTSGLCIRKNAEGFYVHPESSIVFDPVTGKAYGRWLDEQIKSMTVKEILFCQQAGIPFELPENLDLGIIKVIDPKLIEELGEDDFKEDPNDIPSDEEGDDDD
jgi:hypothetical protein